MNDDIITYLPGAIGDFAADVGSRSGQLHEIHSDATRRTHALADFFAGHGATGFFDAQHQMLSGLAGLAEVVGAHAGTTTHVLDSAGATDEQIKNLF